MKKIIKNPIFMFILGAIISGGITGVLAYKLAANQVSFTPSDSTWQVSDVDNALDSLFDMATYGNASASDIVSGKTALVNGAQVTGNLTVPSYQTLANTENVSAGSSSSARTGYYYLNNYKVTCGTTTCPSYTSLSGTQNVGAGSSSTTLNGYYNMSNYKVSCASCPSCPSCNSTPSLPFILYYGSNYNSNKYRHFTVPDNYDSVYCSMYGGSTSGFYINGSQISGVTLYASKKYANTGYTHNIYKLNRNLRKGEVIGVNVPAGGQYIEFFGASVGGGATLNVEGNSYINVS